MDHSEARIQQLADAAEMAYKRLQRRKNSDVYDDDMDYTYQAANEAYMAAQSRYEEAIEDEQMYMREIIADRYTHTECAICDKPIEKGNGELVRCGHTYHRTCLDERRRVARQYMRKLTCVACGKEIPNFSPPGTR